MGRSITNCTQAGGRVAALLAAICGFAPLQQEVTAGTAVITPFKDNTLINSPNLSNGAGEGIFCGRTGGSGGNTVLRALLAFDIAANVPAGSTIDSVTLDFYVLQSVSGSLPFNLHRVLADWGEGTSSGFGALGSAAAPGDATWTQRFYPSVSWVTPGGQFSSTISATVYIGVSDSYTISSEGMRSNVQYWLDNPASNFGWLIKANNETSTFTAKKIGSRNHKEPLAWPRLTVQYTTPPPVCVGDINHDQTVNADDLVELLQEWGPCKTCDADLNHSGGVDVDDLVLLLSNWGACG